MYAFVIIIALVLLAVAYHFFTRKRAMSQDEFIEAVRLRILSNHPNVTIKSADKFDWILLINDKEQQWFLDNTYARYCQQPVLFNELVDYMIDSISNMDDSDISWEQAKSRILPSLKSEKFLIDNYKLPGGAEIMESLVSFDYINDLNITIAIDSEMSMSFVNKKHLETWGVSEQFLLDTSIANLSKLTAQYWAESTRLAQESGLFAFATQDGYDASRILLPDFYERASRALGCEKILVGIPNRDFIAAIPENSPGKDKFYKQIQNDARVYDHAITSEIITIP
jgi:uncharacterized protein YtpQ (UPF0354 family)